MMWLSGRVLLSQELVEITTEELSAWEKCLWDWENRCNRLCPYFVETGSGQCDRRNEFKKLNLATGEGLSEGMKTQMRMKEKEKADKAAAAAKKKKANAACKKLQTEHSDWKSLDKKGKKEACHQ